MEEPHKEVEQADRRLTRRTLLLGGLAVVLAPAIALGVERLDEAISNRPNNSPNIPPTQIEYHEGLQNALSPELRKLAEYEQLYGPITDELMLFSDTPVSAEQAMSFAESIAAKLKEFAEHGIKPLVVFEPVAGDNSLDFRSYQAGEYDRYLKRYFEALKTNDVTDEMMGTWVLFPEANTPAWNSTTQPAIIAECITRTALLLKHHFPQSKASMLLDSKTYESNDALWQFGQYASLMPYVERIPQGLIDSFGLQGFPWASPANEGAVENFDPAVFLNAPMAIEAAHELGVSNIWFNSGTFSQMHTQHAEQTVHVPPYQRQEILTSILSQAQIAQNAGFEVTINLFSADKSRVNEGVDWSYTRGAADNEIFYNFVGQTIRNDIRLTLFDSTDTR